MKELQVKQLLHVGSSQCGKWYVSNVRQGFLPKYLHPDLVLRDSTVHNNNFSGYYNTKEEAEQTLTKYLELA